MCGSVVIRPTFEPITRWPPWNLPFVWFVTLLMFVMLVIFVTFTTEKLFPPPHQGKKGSMGPSGHQPNEPKPQPNPQPK